MRGSAWLTRTIGFALAAALVTALTGCATPNYRFVGSSDRDLVMRVPRNWTEINTDDALKASGVDPKSRTGWATFYDASSKPSAQHMKTGAASAPVLVAQSLDVSEAERSQVTDAGLRDLVLPGTAEVRAAATANKEFAVIEDKTVSTPAQHGVHIVFFYRIDGTPEYFDQVVLTNPKRTRVHLVAIHCTQQCFTAHSREIDDVVSSLTLKSN